MPVSHHLEPSSTYCVNDLGTLSDISDLEFLLEENGCLLIRESDDTLYEDMVGRRGGRLQERKKVDGLFDII